MTTLEQVEKLREKTNVSYNEAKEALEAANGDLLDAMIYLEKKGKVSPPEGGGHYDSSDSHESTDIPVGESSAKKTESPAGESFGDLINKFIKFCGKIIHKGNINNFEIYKGTERKASFPITLLVVLAVLAFWITLPLIIIGLFFGLRYRFNGPDIKKSAVNTAMDTAADTAENIKKSFTNSGKQG